MVNKPSEKTALPDRDLKFKIMEATLNSSPIPMFWCNKHRFLVFNEAFVSVTSHTEEELYEKNFDDLSRSDNAFDSLDEIHKTNEPREVKMVTWHLENKKGDKRIYELRLTKLLIDPEDSDHTYYGVMRNLDNVNINNEIFSDVIKKLQDSLAASRQGVWEWYAELNSANLLDTHIGISDRNADAVDFDQKLFLKKVHPEDQPRVKVNWEHTINSTDLSFYKDEYRILNKEGKYVWVRSEGKVMERNSQGKPIRLSGIIRDIDEQKEREQTIMAQTQNLIDYAFMNSHLLRGPATSILGLVDLLADEYNEENLRELKKTSLKLDETIHEINRRITDRDGERLKQSPIYVKKVSLICNDTLQSLILKNTLEEIDSNVQLDFNQNLNDYYSVDGNDQFFELVILDEDSYSDPWDFLARFEELHPGVPVYILTSHFNVATIDKLNLQNCVQGIILKSEDQHGILEFIKGLKEQTS